MSPCEERITTAFTFASLLDACASRLDMPLLTTATSLNVSIRCLSSQSGVLPCCIRKYWAVRYMDTDRYTDSVRDANGKWNLTLGRSLSMTGQSLVIIEMTRTELNAFWRVVF